MTFHALNLNPRLLENIAQLGYEVPTPIQRQAIPPVLQGRDVIGLAQTGTGKTAAFGLPILQKLMEGPRGQLRALIVDPTRELAEQTREALDGMAQHTGLRTMTVYGGVGMKPQIDHFRRGVEISIACPGRLLDHVRQGNVRLSHVEILVLDEADRMFDMGFLPDIKKILKAVPARRQTLLFSATMPEPIKRLAHEILHDPHTVSIAASRPVASVKHALFPVQPHQKMPLLLAILSRIESDSVLVFCRTKHRARRLSGQLVQAGHRAACLQGDMSQRERTQAMEGFRSGRHQILVATDIAARGLDISTISHVINFDMPMTVDDYTHRIGRTGRAAKSGDAFTLITLEDEGVVRGIERLLQAPIERRTLEGFDYSVGMPSIPKAVQGQPIVIETKHPGGGGAPYTPRPLAVRHFGYGRRRRRR